VNMSEEILRLKADVATKIIQEGGNLRDFDEFWRQNEIEVLVGLQKVSGESEDRPRSLGDFQSLEEKVAYIAEHGYDDFAEICLNSTKVEGARK